MLNRGDITTLKKTRERVQALERRIEHGPRDFTQGRLAEACQACDAAILQVLILARVHDLGVTDEDMRLTPQIDAA